MLRLIELTLNGEKEVQAIYPFESKDALEGDYEFKLGTAMENNTDEMLIGLDNVGEVLFSARVGDHAFAPRLYEAKYTTEEEVDLKKYDTVDTLRAKFHKIKGSAIKNDAVKQEILRGFDENGNSVEYCQWVRTVEPVIPE